MNSKKHAGAVQMEYLVVTLALMAAMWWAIVGDLGYRGTNDHKYEDDSFMAKPTEELKATPSLINALNDKQFQFANDVYQP